MNYEEYKNLANLMIIHIRAENKRIEKEGW